ncbi:hypothetical protein OCH239_12600 [Roseivivax halodurans JCM 10272]|uniref:Uncharacterized protein n=1 Tax=Roseivivax halodurans JCM 10272 TaxID=1449350 RepID=X7EBD0_9RHOB|nr:hypothetical protein [Roseivivax halodurans]ETX13272.1 hypothetical protein OCH239_12600 [Roseivivax halodurans JCM 10272]
MKNMESRIARLESETPSVPTVGAIIIRSAIRPGSSEPVKAFAYLLSRAEPSRQLHIRDGETFEEFNERVERASSQAETSGKKGEK